MPTNRGGLSLQEENINPNERLLIDPDNIFWAYIFGKDSNIETKEKIYSLYTRFKHKFDKTMREFRFKTSLNSVYINPTDRCNADCPYCYIPGSMRKYGSQMNNQQLNYILEKIDKYFVNYRKKYSAKPTIIYHGSEPLMVKKILFYSIEGLSNKFHFGIQTNASLLEKKDVDFLKSHKVSIGISLDSSNPEINNLTRRTSDFKSFNGTIQALDWFGDYKGLSVITTVTKYGLNPSVCNLRLD